MKPFPVKIQMAEQSWSDWFKEVLSWKEERDELIKSLTEKHLAHEYNCHGLHVLDEIKEISG